jgi:hypothetical protein
MLLSLRSLTHFAIAGAFFEMHTDIMRVYLESVIRYLSHERAARYNIILGLTTLTLHPIKRNYYYFTGGAAAVRTDGERSLGISEIQLGTEGFGS